MEKAVVNSLPSPTWNWLKMNKANVDGIDLPEVDNVSKSLKTGESDVVVMDIKSKKDTKVSGVHFQYALEPDADLTLIQVQRLDDEDVFFNEVEGTLAENAHFHLIQVFLGGGKVFVGALNTLQGKEAFLEIDSAYLLEGRQELDMNYVADHIGKRTQCRMKTDGVLRDEAKKLYRGTIDFKKGCAGAVGNETEDVLLMDEKVVNKTIPVILCAEEDVEGNHGATIGNLDENILFYMQSRGIEKQEAYEMMARARVEAVVHQIPDETLKNDVLDWLEKRVALEG